jgi:hypothetical protein
MNMTTIAERIAACEPFGDYFNPNAHHPRQVRESLHDAKRFLGGPANDSGLVFLLRAEYQAELIDNDEFNAGLASLNGKLAI